MVLFKNHQQLSFLYHFFKKNPNFTSTYSLVHKCHVVLMVFTVLVISFFLLFMNFIYSPVIFCNPFEQHSFFHAFLLIIARISSLFAAPQAILCFLGLLLCEIGKKTRKYVQNEGEFAQKICVSVVTRGDYPDLVNYTLAANIDICEKVLGIPNCFIFQLLTERSICIDERIRDKVQVFLIPKQYRTKSGVLYKGRNLQYGLEQNLNLLADNDWLGEHTWAR